MFAVLHLDAFALHAVLRTEAGGTARPAALFSGRGKKSAVTEVTPAARAAGAKSWSSPSAAALRVAALAKKPSTPAIQTAIPRPRKIRPRTCGVVGVKREAWARAECNDSLSARSGGGLSELFPLCRGVVRGWVDGPNSLRFSAGMRFAEGPPCPPFVIRGFVAAGTAPRPP